VISAKADHGHGEIYRSAVSGTQIIGKPEPQRRRGDTSSFEAITLIAATMMKTQNLPAALEEACAQAQVRHIPPRDPSHLLPGAQPPASKEVIVINVWPVLREEKFRARSARLCWEALACYTGCLDIYHRQTKPPILQGLCNFSLASGVERGHFQNPLEYATSEARPASAFIEPARTG